MVEPVLLERYADLIVSLGANVQEGQIVAVEAAPEAQPLVHAVVARAYDAGARYVDVSYIDPIVKRIRLERARDETLEFIPPWLGQRLLGLGEADSARIVLVPTVPPGVLAGVDPARAARDRLPSLPEVFTLLAERSTNWTLSPYPLRAWAERVYSGDGDAVERLWRDIVHVCRLDEPDPAAAWRERVQGLHEMATRIDALGLDALHFEGPGTDLTVGLLPSSTFAGDGPGSRTRRGIVHYPNIPTEEIFSTPDPQRADGVVTATKPLDVAGATITGLRMRFEGGRVVELEAEQNADVLRGRVGVDEGARRLGEVALVDREGRIGTLDRTFFNTLLDENAASHVALGSAYVSGVRDEADLARINRSDIHIDFMIGSNDVDVTGVGRDGSRVPLLRGGAWQL